MYEWTYINVKTAIHLGGTPLEVEPSFKKKLQQFTSNETETFLFP